MTVVITGGRGFLGWHLRCHLRARHGVDVVVLGRGGFEGLREIMTDADGGVTIYHLAGVNRAEDDELVEGGNVQLANALAKAVRAAARPVHVVYANSIQSELHNPYGRGKARAREVLASATAEVGGSLADVLLPNIFGEHARPHYNSFIATFCYLLARGEVPNVLEDREVPLLHAQRAAEALCAAGQDRRTAVSRPTATPKSVSEVLTDIERMSVLYGAGELPDLSDPFATELFNTYRAYTFPTHFPVFPRTHEDARGSLFESVRMHGGTGQAFVSTTRPGRTRGEHYHLRKFERFIVLSGQAEIKLRRMFTNEIVTFNVSGKKPGFVDMPTMWVHNITNVGDAELTTMFWADQLLDPNDPDQYFETVEENVP